MRFILFILMLMTILIYGFDAVLFLFSLSVFILLWFTIWRLAQQMIWRY